MTEQQAEFLDWWVTPNPDKVPRSIIAWAVEHDVTTETLRRWRKHDWWEVALRKRLAELNVSPDRVQAVIDNLFAAACSEAKDRVQAARVLLEYTQQLMPVQPVLPADRGPENLTDEEVEAEYARLLLEEARAKQRDSSTQVSDVQPKGIT